MMEEDKVITEKEFNRNPLLDEQIKTTEEDSEFKNFIVNWTGQEHQPKDGDVTVEMIVETLAKNFPEVVMASVDYSQRFQSALPPNQNHHGPLQTCY